MYVAVYQPTNLEVRGEERVVHDEEDVLLGVDDLGHGLDVGDLKGGVARGLNPDLTREQTVSKIFSVQFSDLSIHVVYFLTNSTFSKAICMYPINNIFYL